MVGEEGQPAGSYHKAAALSEHLEGTRAPAGSRDGEPVGS